MLKNYQENFFEMFEIFSIQKNFKKLLIKKKKNRKNSINFVKIKENG